MKYFSVLAISVASTAAVAVAAEIQDALPASIQAGRAARAPNGFDLILADGKHLAFRNKVKGCPEEAVDGRLDGANCSYFSLADDVPAAHAFVVRQSAYEGGNFLLVDDRTGRKTQLEAKPLFSPDGTHFIVQNDDEVMSHRNNLEIWMRRKDGATLEWAHSVKLVAKEIAGNRPLYHTDVIAWRDNVIRLEFSAASTFDTDTGKIAPDLRWKGKIRLSEGKWLLEADWPKKH